MWQPGMWELVVILIIVLVVFGTGKLSNIGSSLGTAIRDFKQSVKEVPEKDDKPEEKKDEETS
ncbi:MAG TPA: twin-arginine translocase TatA/TatE family subunit [Candidatus Hydrogenedentes bacterium]|nr:twin-arginine translocase TatA/TatE family subunit [Candidatus Hydrogenedentota bacterium]HQE83972.1 twin-arginine translocase TatA/TatE family subunit [Candidatus Hydrogenedentota bacterium]HQH54508.1 twin-arginine translocase TatA/TatE family subunit [Candidatus Hydrogenedentota bacterium]HQM50613.1 twin-arginine translocase TatA/TatE family subunit [Candidatus Hydrogenedentota bacterium]